MPSVRLEDYQIGQVLGVGTVGTIYRATEIATDHVFAIKKLHPTISSDPLIRARFRREMIVMQRLNHPNIIRFYGAGEDDGTLFYAMELVTGGTVKDLMTRQGALTWPVVVDITRQVSSALQCAHNNGVVHRDLKPGNLFLSPEGDVKLGDFGLARDLQGADISASGMTVGTHAYMAPEQITGDTTLSGKADLYSLGCCMFEMLVGRKPFAGDNYAQIFDQHLRTPPPKVRDFVPNCPPSLEEIVEQLLAKKPEDRPFNARQVQAAMMQLDEQIVLEPDRTDAGFAASGGAKSPEADDDDVGAASVVASRGGDVHAPWKGHQVLQRQLRSLQSRRPPSDVSWGRLAAVAVVIVLLAVLAAVFGR